MSCAHLHNHIATCTRELCGAGNICFLCCLLFLIQVLINKLPLLEEWGDEKNRSHDTSKAFSRTKNGDVVSQLLILFFQLLFFSTTSQLLSVTKAQINATLKIKPRVQGTPNKHKLFAVLPALIIQQPALTPKAQLRVKTCNFTLIKPYSPLIFQIKMRKPSLRAQPVLAAAPPQ